MKHTFLKNGLLALLVISFVFACTFQDDIDLNPQKKQEILLVNEFLGYDGSEPGVSKLITGLKARNNETPFILNMINKYGFPSWKDAFIFQVEPGGIRNEGETNETETFASGINGSNNSVDSGEEFSEILVPVIKEDIVTSIVRFQEVEGEMNIYQVFSKEKLDEIGNQRAFDEGEITLGGAFLLFENRLYDKTKIRAGAVTIELVEEEANSPAYGVYFVWNHECTQYTTTPDPENDFWGPNAGSITSYECEWVLYQVITASDPIIPDGPDTEAPPGPGGGPNVTTLVDSTDTCKTSKDEVKAVFSNLSSSNAEKVAEAINQYGKQFGIDTEGKLAHFLAQAGKETAGLTLLTELTSWSEAGLLSEFPNRFSRTDSTKKDPSEYARNGAKFANLVYAGRNGNGDIDSGDGYKYRGRGIIQITGKEKYQSFTNYYQTNFNSTSNFVTNPDLISNDIKLATIVSMWFWQRDIAPNVSDYSSTDDAHKEITELVRNTENTWEERKAFFEDLEDEIDCVL